MLLLIFLAFFKGCKEIPALRPLSFNFTPQHPLTGLSKITENRIFYLKNNYKTIFDDAFSRNMSRGKFELSEK